MLGGTASSTCTDVEPPALVWVNVHHPTDTQQKQYRRFIRSSVTKEQHRKLRNDRGLKRSRSPTPTSPRPSSRRRRSFTEAVTNKPRASLKPSLQPDWLILLLPPYERTLSPEDQIVFDGLARQEPVLRTALQAMMIARHCRVFLHRTRNIGSNAVQPVLTAHEHTLVQRKLAKLSGLTDLERLAWSIQLNSTDRANSGEVNLMTAMADAIGEEAWKQIESGEQIVRRRMEQADFSPSCNDAAMGTIAARLQCEVELAGEGEHAKTAGQCCARLMDELESRVPTASPVSEPTLDGWWEQFEHVMGAPLSALLTEPMVRHLVAHSLEQARDLLGSAMFVS